MTPMEATGPNRMSCDLLVVGSGASGLAAAVTAAWHGLKVVVVEKESVFGGATAWSSGWMWVPGNPLAKRAGIHEDPQQPRTYLKNELGDRYDPSRMQVRARTRWAPLCNSRHSEGPMTLPTTWGSQLR